jgi:maltooligosyltrehalose trehalohydrolase
MVHETATPRRAPIGAEPSRTGTHFRVWAPARHRVRLELENGRVHELGEEPGGYFSGLVADARAGCDYRFLLDDDPRPYPDPASRFQPEGPHGPSRVVDPDAFRWSDGAWGGRGPQGHVVYEMHVGTFTAEGTWAAAGRHLPRLAELGVTTLEIMPVADFPGRFGWGYDGVCLWAPTRLYGTPDDMRAFVDAAHGLGLGVILDVVYNHLGPDGNYLAQFAPGYFTSRHQTEWGEPIDFDGPRSQPVREFFVANAAYWIREMHLDGLRLDATQSIFDESPDHILAEIARAAIAAAGGRRIFLVAENERQETRLVRPPERGGYGLHALWNDDFHHSAVVALTGKREAYYSETRGTAHELLAAAKHGYLYQGQRYHWQKQRRGSPTRGLPPEAMVCCLENHDQVANSADGRRLHLLTSPGRWRAMTALLLLAPWTPMLFQGQELASVAPFLYFADHGGDLGRQVRQGRRQFLTQFPSMAGAELDARMDDPTDEATFARCKLASQGDAARQTQMVALHRDLLALRRDDPLLAGRQRRGFDGAVLGEHALLLRWFDEGEGEMDRLLVLNLGADLPLIPAPEPLLGPPEARRWQVLWSSDAPAYGGRGVVAPETEEHGWLLPGEAAVLLRSEVRR